MAAARGYRLTLTMPESMSLERRALLAILGANLVLTPGQGRHERGDRQGPRVGGRDAQQLDSPAVRQPGQSRGPRADHGPGDLGGHRRPGGHDRGRRRHRRHDHRRDAVHPREETAISGRLPSSRPIRPVISGGKPGPHKIQGIGAGFIPKNLDTSLLSGVETVTNDEAFTWARRLAREEGILGGISTGANVAAAIRLASRPENRGKVIVTFAPSCGERYLSTALFEGLKTQ